MKLAYSRRYGVIIEHYVHVIYVISLGVIRDRLKYVKSSMALFLLVAQLFELSALYEFLYKDHIALPLIV